METISNTLFWISNGLLVPVVVLLLLFFLRAIILAGGFFGEFYQRMNLQKQFTETLENITPENIDGLLQQLPSAGNSPLLRNLSKLSAHRDDAAYCEHLLANYEMEAEKELGRSRTFIKLGPMLGLMGTLIPMGPAWGSNQTLFLPQYQYFQKFRLCVRHALVLKNCLLLSSVCLPTSWVQMYALFWDYANR